MKNLNTYRLLICCTFWMTLLSCGKESSCFKDTGKIVKEERAISNLVKGIVLEDDIDVVITQSSEAKLTVEGGVNLLPYIHTEIIGNELHISDGNSCSLFRNYNTPVVVYLSIPDLNKIVCSGQGLVTSSNQLKFPNLLIDVPTGTGSLNLDVVANQVSLALHAGASDLTLKGSVIYIYAFNAGNGWVYLNDFRAQYVHAYNAGSGDLHVRADSNLLVELTSVGNIIYSGNPTVSVSVHSGSGELRRQ